MWVPDAWPDDVGERSHMNSTAQVDIAAFLDRQREPILTAGGAALGRARVRHYASVGEDTIHERLSTLFDRLVAALARRDLDPIVTYAEQVADERFEAGYDLSEVQVAFNALEEATWSRVLAELSPAEFAEAIGLISTVLGAGKDALARRYVARAARTQVRSLDLRAVFAGTP
jgi:hypothetical protein